MITTRKILAVVSLLLLSSMILANCTPASPINTETVDKTATITPTKTEEPIIQGPSPTPTINDVVLAPLVVSSRYNIETGTELENQMLFSMQLDGTIEKQLTEPGLDYFNPRWSPDCRSIVYWIYVGYQEGTYDERLGVFHINMNSFTEISTPFERNSNPSWSPDGRRIVFDAYDGQDWQIYTYDLDTSEISQLTFDGNNVDPDWSATTEQIVFSSSRDEVDVWSIYVMNADGSEQREIVPASWGSDSGDWDNPFINSPRTPTWSPNGEIILFRVVEEVYDIELYERTVKKMYVTEIDEFSPQRLIQGNRRIIESSDPDYYYWSEFFPAWSPDGQQVLFVWVRQLAKDNRFCTLNLASGETSCKSDGSAAGFWGMDWCHSDQETTGD